MRPALRRAPDPLAAHNEQMKLLAGTVNTVGVAIVGIALLKPLIEGTLAVDGTLALSCAVSLASHGLSHYFQGTVAKEARDDDV